MLLTELEGLAKVATQRLWAVVRGNLISANADIDLLENEHKARNGGIYVARTQGPDDKANANLIVALVNNLPAILQALRAQEPPGDGPCKVCGVANRSHHIHGAPFNANYHPYEPPADVAGLDDVCDALDGYGHQSLANRVRQCATTITAQAAREARLREAFLKTQTMLEQIAHLKSTNFREVQERIVANRAALEGTDHG